MNSPFRYQIIFLIGFSPYTLELAFKINIYKSWRYGTLCVRENPGCLFIATNRDAVTHLTETQEWAGLISFPFILILFSLFHYRNLIIMLK